MEEKIECPDVYDEGKNFLEEVKGIIREALKMNKKVEYKSENILILSIKDDLHSVFEVYNNETGDLSPKLVYIGDKKLKKSYLLNLINKEENRVLINKGCS